MTIQSSTSRASIRLILLAALGCLLFVVSGGFFLLRNTQNLVSAARWVQHSQEVRLALQNASFLTQRIELEDDLYRLEQSEKELANSQQAAIRLNTSINHLKTLVADNPHETSNIEMLNGCSSELIKELTHPHPEAETVDAYLLRCRHVLALMTNDEDELLKKRDEASRKNSQVSVITELTIAFVCALLLVILFGLLLRDAIVRNRISLLAEKTNQDLKDSVQTLRDHARDSQLLAIARDDLQLCTDEQQVHQSAAFRFSELLHGTSGSVCIINSSRNMVETVSSWSADHSAPLVSEIFPPDTCCGLRSGQLRWYSPEASHIHCNHFVASAPDRYLCIPLVAHGDTLGILFIHCPDEATQKVIEARLGGIRQLVQLTAMALASLHMRQKLEHQSVRDGLTNLFNRHFLEIAIERELARAVRRKSSLAVLMIDVDHFKRLNDQFGHAAGDAVLKEVSRVFLDKTRTEDLACRYGGEEFTIILPDISPEIALHRAEVIREAVANLRTQLDNTLYNNVTISIGVAIFPHDGQTSDLLLRHADAALYRAKHEGRNKVVMDLQNMPNPVATSAS